jgi:hypothetical protein
MEVPNNISPEDLARLEEIRSLPLATIAEAIKWWNHEAPDPIKKFIIVCAYYEGMLSTTELADEVLRQWSE